MVKTKHIIILLFMSMLSCRLQAQVERINIWEGTSVHKNVSMTSYIASGSNNPCIIVCPGGSYFWHDMENEGVKVAQWLQDNGITAFVLHYRTGYVPAFIFHTRLFYRGNQYPDPQNDLQRAIELVRENADKYHIDTKKVGAMGFSAGGHLVMSAAEFFREGDSKPNYVAPIYPVVSLSAPCTHKRSRRGLLGEYRKYKKVYRDSLSLEKHVPQDCPAVFLVNCVDDPIVDYHNSELLDSALTANRVTHKYIQYKTGGHGFGASDEKGTAECRQWRDEFMKWLKDIGIVKGIE